MLSAFFCGYFCLLGCVLELLVYVTSVTTKYDTFRCENLRYTFRINRLEILLGIDYLTVEICLGCSRNEARAGSDSKLIIVYNSLVIQQLMLIYGSNYPRG